jgi:hypothetical protein
MYMYVCISVCIVYIYIPFEIGLDEHWKHHECNYDFTANINIRSNSGSDVKSHINDVDLEAEIVATSQRPL